MLNFVLFLYLSPAASFSVLGDGEEKADLVSSIPLSCTAAAVAGMKVYPPLSLLEQSESCKADDMPGDKSSHRQRKDGASSARTEGPSILASSEKPPVSA